MIGLTVNHYQIDKELGAGGMGVVYQARDLRLDRPVALKFLNFEQVPGTLRSRFQQEARTASSLNHPNICTIYDVGEFEGRPYIVMEYLEGQTLKEVLQQEELDATKAAAIVLDLAGALEAAHGRGVIHRDIKPANIFLTESGGVKLLDFGIAKREEASGTSQESTALTEVGTTLGTVSYMSPEQALSKPLDHRTDLFSLGIVFYEMLSGSHPFQDVTAPSTIDAIIHRRPEELDGRHSSIPATFRQVIDRLLQKAPEDRYPSASLLSRDLTRLIQGSRPLPLSPASGWKRWWMAAPVILLILAVVLWTQMLPTNPSATGTDLPAQGDEALPSRPVVAVTRLAAPGGDEATHQLGVGIAYALATSLASLPTVTVVSPDSSLDQERDAPTTARELGADYVVSGALQRVGSELRVDLNLVKSGAIVWGGTVQGDTADLFAIQRELVDRLTAPLNLELTEPDRARLSAAPTENKEAYADYMQGRAFLERPDLPENLDRAVGLFEAAMSKDPAFALARAGLGEAYWAKYERSNDPVWTEQARQEIEAAVDLDPDQAGVRCSLALIYKGTGEYDKALTELSRAQELQPNNDEVQRLMGDTLVAQGRTEEAIQAYSRAIDLRPNFWMNHQALGLGYFQTGRFREAAKHFQRVTELQPDLSWGFHYLGVAHHAAGELEAAEANYRKALELAPSAGTFSNLGTLYYRAGKFAAAAQQYEKSLELRPAEQTNLRNLGDTYLRMGQPKKAESAYIQALELIRDQLRVNPNDARLLAMTALVEAKLGRHQEAARHAEQAVSRAPSDSLVLYRSAVAHTLGGRLETAMKLLRGALDAGYSASEVSVDDDLTGLRGRADFQSLVQTK